ncbi:hypothetical protein V0288_12350 [Pannus brasiliensis CCIBt3594]|uniref:Rpn family recombination-promoting nuclease/putative transposase n=1 Tax=Pannus brasiliensis CCIBt3594 TaxID=1427578 RepID=A0AAW9QJE2_9CHRO
MSSRLQRRARRESESYNEEEFPRLWTLFPSASASLLEGFGAISDIDAWGEGVYLFPRFYRTAIVAINRLPVAPDTLWLRLLGRGKVQSQAVREWLQLPIENSLRQNVTELLVSWRVTIEIQNLLEEEDREVFMTLSQTYLEWKEATKQEARREGLEEGRQEGLQEGRQEGLREGRLGGKLESVPRLRALGLSVEQIADALELSIEQVRQATGE